MCLCATAGHAGPSISDVADGEATSSKSESIEKLLEDMMDAEHPAVLNDDASMNPSPNSTATSVFPPEEANSSHLKSLPLGELKMKMKEHGVYESPTTPMDGQAQLSTGCKQTHHQETNADATPANVSEQRLDATTDGPLSHDVSNGHVDAKEFDQTSVLRTSQNEKNDVAEDLSAHPYEPPENPNLCNLFGSDNEDDAMDQNLEELMKDESEHLDSMRQAYVAKREYRLHALEKQFKFPVNMISIVLFAAGLIEKPSEDVAFVRDQLQESGKHWLQTFLAKFGNLSFSTAFSGIDTPSVSLLMLGSAVADLLGISPESIPMPNNLFGIEIYGPSREELLNSSNPPHCLFKDVNDFWATELASRVKVLRENHLIDSVLVPLVKTGEAVKSQAWCHKCGKQCSAGEADVHIAGTSCTAYSPKGNQLGLGDETVLDLMAWVAQRRKTQEKVIVQENVQEFCTEELVSWFADLYWISVVLLDPKLFHWPIRRPRKYHLLIHKQKCSPPSCPLDMFAKLFIKNPLLEFLENGDPRWMMFFVANEHDLNNEINWACKRESTVASIEDQWVLPWEDMSEQGSYWKSLTQYERDNLQKYQEKWPGQTFQLNQNASVTPTRSDDFLMPTLIRNAGIIWNLKLVKIFFVFDFSFVSLNPFPLQYNQFF